VFGRPISIRNEDGSKPKALGKWRKEVDLALVLAVAESTKSRGYVPFEGPVEVHVIWLSTDTSNPLHPDVDNILKPLIDALNRRIISDDIKVHRLLAEKADLNEPPSILLPFYNDIQDDPSFLTTAEVTVVRVDRFTPEFRK